MRDFRNAGLRANLILVSADRAADANRTDGGIAHLNRHAAPNPVVPPIRHREPNADPHAFAASATSPQRVANVSAV